MMQSSLQLQLPILGAALEVPAAAFRPAAGVDGSVRRRGSAVAMTSLHWQRQPGRKAVAAAGRRPLDHRRL